MDALLDQYTQNECVAKLDKFIDKLPIYDSQEIKENLSAIVLHLDEKTLTTEGVYNMSNIMIFQNSAELARERVHLGLNNKFDAALAGVARQELILIGGKRGSGKSILCSNVQVNEYEAGYVCPYFTIEMIARETNERNMAMLAGVNHQHIKQGSLTEEEALRIVKARAGMFLDADDLVEEYKRSRDKFAFEAKLVKEKQLKPDNQMIIIDDRALTISTLDLHLGKLKARHGDKFRVAVVDYLNKIVADSAVEDRFGWKEQTDVSDRLKNLARKHDIVLFTPYQIDASGEARFGKGILDAADIALVVEAHEKEKNAITFKTTKIRGGPDIECTSPINWETLRLSADSIEKPGDSKETKEPKKLKNAAKKDVTVDDSAADIPPWN